MEDRLMTQLITEQPFDPPQTAATETLKKAAAAYHSGEFTKSANLFLKSWRILHIEHLNYICGRFDLLPPWNTEISRRESSGEDFVRHDFSRYYGFSGSVDFITKKLACECQARTLMGFCALSDLALVCLSITGEYKDKNYNWNSLDGTQGYALDVNALEIVDFGDTSTEDLEFDGKVWSKGSRLTNMFCRRVDDMGWKIQFADSFSKFAYNIATFGLSQIHVSLGTTNEHSNYQKFIKSNMERILHLAEQKISVKGTERKEEEEL